MSVLENSLSPAFSPEVAVVPLSGISPAFAAEVAAITRAAYENGDAVPGLPVADGAHETADDVLADLDRGLALWVATVDGRCAGSVRAVRGDVWEVQRLAVAPWTRGAGLARRLVQALEAGALAAGSAVELNAVVERGTPAFYSRAGYRTVYHFGADDKPLSEVRMRREPGTPPEPWSYPETGDRSPTTSGVVVTWWSVPGGTACHVTHNTVAAAVTADRVAVGEGTLIGADHWPDASPAELAAVLETHGGAVVNHDRPAAQLPSFTQPRTVHTGLLAWWR